MTGATNQLSLFGKTFSHITQDLNKGYGLKSYFKILPKEDITNLKLYIRSLETASNEQIVFDRYLKQSSTTAQILGKKIYELRQQLNSNKITQQEYNASVNSMIAAQQTATITTNVLKTALKTIGNIGFALVIDQIITGISNLIKQQEEAKKAAQELSKQFNDDTSSINDYILKISQLKKSLEDSNTLESERKNIKSDLLEIQNDLIKSYGFEADGLDIVNGKLEDNIQLMRNYLKEQYQDIYRKNSIGIEGSVNTLNTPRLSIIQEGGLYAINGIEALINPMHAVDVAGVNKQLNNIYQDLGIDKIELGVFPDDIYTLDKNLEEAQKRIEELMNQDELPNAIYKMYDDAYKYLGQVRKDQIEKIIKDNEENLESYIKGNEKYSDIYFDLFISKANYQEAIKSGDEKAIEEAAQSWVSAFDTAITKAAENGDGAVKSYFVNNFTFDDKSNEIANTAKKITYPVKESLSELNTQLEEVYNSFDTAFSNQSTIQSAFDKIQSGTDLTASEMRGLIKLCKKEFPEIGTLFTKTAKGYTISADNLIKANGAIMNSAKETVQSQIDGYQDVINKYEEYQKKLSYIQDMSDMPDSVKQSQAKVLGITEEEYESAKNELQNLLPLLDMFDISLSSTSESANTFSKAIEYSTKQITFIKSAMEEMSDNGYVSASTYQTLVEKGEKYVECLDLVNGKLVLNIEKLKDLEAQQLRNLIVDNNIRINKLNESLAHGANADAIRDEINAIRGQNAALEQQIEDIWSTEPTKSGSSKTEDPIKEAFEKDMKDIEHLHNMGLKSDEEYYDALEKANEKHYKNSAEHESDYLSNVEKIYKARQSLYKDDADKQFDDLEDQYKRGIITAERYAQGLHDLGQELYGEDSIYGGTEFAVKALEELDKKVKETSDDIYDEFKEGLSADGDKTLFNVLSDAEELWNRTNELFAGDLTSIKSNAKDIFGTVSSALEDALKKGIITVDGYESLLRSWANTLQVTEADITDALVDTYEYRADALQKANGGSLASERKYIADMKSLNFSTYGDEDSDFYDPTTYASNLRDITDHQLDVLEKALNNGEISVQEYANSVVEIFKDADVLGADYVSEKLDDIDKVRAEREKTYWEQQKELMEDYYDKQIKEIEDTQKAKEKENKLEELHLKLIKARQTLEEAKNNRNQLVFHDGTFEYMSDQDAVMSAEEEVANTLKEIENEKLQEQIDLLEEQKDAALGFYDQILDEIDFYLNKTLPLSESDQEELAKIRNSDYAQYARDKRDGNLIANSDNEKIAGDALNQSDTAEETKQSVSDIAKNVLDIGKLLANGFNFENLVRALGGNPTAEAVKNFQDSYNATLVGKQIEPSTVSGVTNNSSTTNNNAKTVNIGDIHLNFDVTLNSLDDFVNGKIDEALLEVGRYVKQKMPAILAKA